MARGVETIGDDQHSPASETIPTDHSAVRCQLVLRSSGGLANVREVGTAAAALSYIRTVGPANVDFVIIDQAEVTRDEAEIAALRRDYPGLILLTPLTTRVGSPHPGATAGSLTGGVSGEGVSPLKPTPVSADAGILLGCGWTLRNRTVLEQVASADAPVLLQGETGVGKEVVARFLHAHSVRAAKPFVKVNCAALPSELVESELFGYERGAFTGAFGSKPGKFELADEGTIFLDEIGDMDLRLQAKLLQVLQDSTFDRLGGRGARHVDVRVMAATHCDLDAAVRDGRFRQDLFYRLNVIAICIPALRERRDEIIPLCEFLVRKCCPAGIERPHLTAGLKDALVNYEWPGNVRELENVIHRLLVFRNPEGIEREVRRFSSIRQVRITRDARVSWNDPNRVRGPEVGTLEHLEKATRRAEAEALISALEASHWNRREAARRLNLNYKALLYRMHKLGIDARTAEGDVRDPGSAAFPEIGEQFPNLGTCVRVEPACPSRSTKPEYPSNGAFSVAVPGTHPDGNGNACK